MAPLWVVVLTLAPGPPDAIPPTASPPSPPAAAEKPALPPPSGQELSAAVRAALRRWARPSDAQADQAAREFLALYQQLQQDQKLGPATREQLRQTVRTRLAHLADQIARRASREKREAAKSQFAKSVKTPPDRTDNMAQWGGPGLGAMGFPGGAGAGPGHNADYGPQLVDLIQRTIAPSTWDVNGGPGTIYYWRPSRALVVRQTDEVHGQISDTLQQLHRLSR